MSVAGVTLPLQHFLSSTKSRTQDCLEELWHGIHGPRNGHCGQEKLMAMLTWRGGKLAASLRYLPTPSQPPPCSRTRTNARWPLTWTAPALRTLLRTLTTAWMVSGSGSCVVADVDWDCSIQFTLPFPRDWRFELFLVFDLFDWFCMYLLYFSRNLRLYILLLF